MPEDIKATWDKLGIPEAEKNYLGGVTAQYECLRGSTLVWTTAGMRPIKELQPGDEVFSLDEDTKKIVRGKVVGQAMSGEKEIFEVKSRGRTIGASANHPFLVLRDERKPGRQRRRYAARWVPVEELQEGDLVAVATDVPGFGESASLIVPDIDECATYPRYSTEDLCWWLGVFVGDGYIRQGEYPRLEIAIDRTDESLVAEIQRVTKVLFGIDLEPSADGLRLKGRGTRALVEFMYLNGFEGTALTKRVPEWMFGAPVSQRLAFLGGYIDADGYVRDHATSKDIVLHSANESLLGDLRELLALCGITSSRISRSESKHPVDRRRTMVSYFVHLSGRFDRIACRSPRRVERMNRRRYFHNQTSARGTTIRAHTSDMLGFVRVESIESVGVEPTYDIEVEGHHNFVAEGFIVHNSEVVYHKTKEELEKRGIIFTDMDTALREHEDIVKQYFGTIIPPADNKFSALNSAVWSGGSFIYVPPNTEVEIPLQAYFRINQENMGQFERTLIIVDEDSWVHYVEGCSAPIYSSDSLHSAVVEIVVKKRGRARYTTIQNWSNNVYNLVTKRAAAYEDAIMEWVDGNLGSKVTMKYPSVYLLGERARGEVLSIAYAGAGQHQDAGGKVIHAAPNTQSSITSKSISKDGGRGGYRGLVRIEEGAEHSKSHVICDALILDEKSRSDTYPYIEIEEESAAVSHEASVSKVSDEQLFYLMSRGLGETEAMQLIVRGFIEPIVKELPLEYAVELQRLVELQMEGSVG
ncbi:MAG TPA: Fe-S cluster assembly protein SufB [Actinomycetota bacterium]|nr:Fe-S cluster assembly protein SufB [Actinomycetota bacterium]